MSTIPEAGPATIETTARPRQPPRARQGHAVGVDPRRARRHRRGVRRACWPTHFLTAGNLTNIMQNVSIWAVIAVGMTFVIITSGIDLSVGSVLVVSSVVAAKTMEAMGGEGWGVALVGLVVAVVVGAVLGHPQRVPRRQGQGAAAHRHPGHAVGGPGHRADHHRWPRHPLGADRPAGQHRLRPRSRASRRSASSPSCVVILGGIGLHQTRSAVTRTRSAPTRSRPAGSASASTASSSRSTPSPASSPGSPGSCRSRSSARRRSPASR